MKHNPWPWAFGAVVAICLTAMVITGHGDVAGSVAFAIAIAFALFLM